MRTQAMIATAGAILFGLWTCSMFARAWYL